MREVRVNGGGDDLTANLPELVGSVTESDDLSWAHKGEVQWIEEKDDILPCTKGEKKAIEVVMWGCTNGNYSLINILVFSSVNGAHSIHCGITKQ